MLVASTSSAAKLDDYVATAIPQMRGLYVGSWVMVNAMARAVGEYYARNTEHNYMGVSNGGGVDLSKLTSRLWEGTTGDQSGQGGQSVWKRLSTGAGEYAQQSVHRQSGGSPHAGPQHGGQLHERVSALSALRGAATGPAEPHSGGLLNFHRRDL